MRSRRETRPRLAREGVTFRFTLMAPPAQADGQSERARRIGLLPPVRTTWSIFVGNAGEGRWAGAGSSNALARAISMLVRSRASEGQARFVGRK